MRRLPMLLLLPLWLAGGLAAAQPDALRSYSIDAASSQVYWLVYKAGALARLGHNHVISAPQLTGHVTLNSADLSASTFELEIPVASLVIDDPALRAGLGDDFASVPTAEDIAGTRKNMLSDRVLEGAKFPVLRLSGTGPTGPAGMQTLHVKVELVGHSVELTLPTTVVVGDQGLEAEGKFELNHADLGLKPFSVMMGALQVAEKMSFSYRIRAMPADTDTERP
jgi:polyisoprenoid-binding protein YceI